MCTSAQNVQCELSFQPRGQLTVRTPRQPSPLETIQIVVEIGQVQAKAPDDANTPKES